MPQIQVQTYQCPHLLIHHLLRWATQELDDYTIINAIVPVRFLQLIAFDLVKKNWIWVRVEAGQGKILLKKKKKNQPWQLLAAT